ncbi:aminotransferase class I/II-fold pyridoxal phosphate-dependent enzyme [Marinibactrum halimedae]|nr:aminotransferase class I/II-fold pyridoxal phosphate-dependent enzyme [Marinibactrum halimedae]
MASALTTEYQAHKDKGLKLDLTRGKPSSEQLDLSDALDGILNGDYTTANGTDARNYGGIDGISELKALGAEILDVKPEQILVGGNASLALMFQAVMQAHVFGFNGPESAWNKETTVKFLCPVPGYDRHFSICETFGIEMVTVPMTATGPDMDQVEAMIKADSQIKGIWCVPKYSNPTGVVYSDDTVKRIAELAKIAGPNFKVFWDNAYIVHDLTDTPKTLANIMSLAEAAGTEDSILQFCSTSKISHAGAGVAFLNASTANLATFKKLLGIGTIGPDKVNQLRHAKLFPTVDALKAHMKKHAEILQPRFECVLKHLNEAFGDNTLGAWESVEGGYFISFDTQPGLASKVVTLAAEAGVKLTPAGATFPYGKDPEDKNIRIAPSVPTMDEVDAAMAIFVTCVQLATVEQQLG